MAGSIPPLVSSSPPPLSAFDDDEEEEEDEFGMYTAHEDIDFNECLSFKEKSEEKQNGGKSRGEQDSTSQDSATDSGLCPDSEGMSPTTHSDEERVVRPSACGRLCDSENRECMPPVANYAPALLNGHIHAEDPCNLPQPDDNFGNFENFTPTRSLQLTEQGVESKDLNEGSSLRSLEKKECNGIVLKSKENTTEEECDTVLKSFPDKTINETSSCGVVDSTLEPEIDFSCEFPVLEQQNLNDGLNIEHEVSDSKVENDGAKWVKEQESEVENNDEEFDDFTDFKANFSTSLEFPETDQSDKLSEHSKPFSEPEHSDEVGKSLQLPQQDESDDDEFSNFADFSSSECAFVSAQSSNSLDNVSHIPLKPSDDTDLRTDSEFQDWVSVFPSSSTPTSEPGAAVELLRDDDVVWSRLFPLESSPALSHLWPDSLANRRLLTALNIDSRNILLMPWSSGGVPRFAANLSCGPLEPVKATEPLQPAPQLTLAQPTLSSTQETVPDAHFDWVGSGLTNPLDYPKPVLILPKTLTAEAESILCSLPELSFMRKTYIDFPISEG